MCLFGVLNSDVRRVCRCNVPRSRLWTNPSTHHSTFEPLCSTHDTSTTPSFESEEASQCIVGSGQCHIRCTPEPEPRKHIEHGTQHDRRSSSGVASKRRSSTICPYESCSGARTIGQAPVQSSLMAPARCKAEVESWPSLAANAMAHASRTQNFRSEALTGVFRGKTQEHVEQA